MFMNRFGNRAARLCSPGNGHILQISGNLKCAAYPHTRNLVGLQIVNSFTVKPYLAGVCLENTADQIEGGGFAGPVRPNQGGN